MQRSRLQKYSKIIICLGGMILLSVGTLAYAQSTTPEPSWNFSQGLQQLITLFSRLWVVLAMGAGKLMSNTFVYGEFMNFDVYLWQMWNISKNFANMAIGFMFLFYVRKLVFARDELTPNEVGKKIGGFLLAGVLIQASWFMMGALLDVERIATSAMGALPGMVIQDNNTRGGNIVDAMKSANILGKKVELTKKSGTNPVSLTIETSTGSTSDPAIESTLDAILPTHNSLSGPLYFIGFAIFQFQSYSETSVDPTLTLKDLSWMFTAIGIKFLVLAAFVIMMLLLFVINIIRVAYLRMVIALAPLIILYIVLKEVLGMDLGSSDSGIMSKINIKTILAYIFQPTIIITFMGLILIAVTALWQGMGPIQTEIQEYGFTITNSGVSHSTFELETKGNLFNEIGDQSRGIFKNLIILGLVFALLLGLIVLSAGSLQITFIENIAKSLGSTIAKIPMIPVWQVGQAGNNILKDTVGIDLLAPGSNRGKLDAKGDAALRELMGLREPNTSDDNKRLAKLNNAIGNPSEYFAELRSWRDTRGDKGLPLASTQSPDGVTGSLIEFLQKNDANDKLAGLGFSSIASALGKDEKLSSSNLQKYLEYGNNAQVLYNQIMQYPTNTNTPNVTAANIMNGTVTFVPPKTTTPDKKPDTPPS